MQAGCLLLFYALLVGVAALFALPYWLAGLLLGLLSYWPRVGVPLLMAGFYPAYCRVTAPLPPNVTESAEGQFVDGFVPCFALAGYLGWALLLIVRFHGGERTTRGLVCGIGCLVAAGLPCWSRLTVSELWVLATSAAALGLIAGLEGRLALLVALAAVAAPTAITGGEPQVALGSLLLLPICLGLLRVRLPDS